ncbi:MAG: ABC transporter permease [Clostridiales bacterium]|nr:ABC transporter permease [Clostridiales bacterium]
MENFLAAAVAAAMPLLFATLGELITEKAGNLNLGVEGMMYMGAVIGFKAGFATGSPLLAVLGAFAAGAFGAAIYAFLTVALRANQVVTGLTLTIFGTGFAYFVGKGMSGLSAPQIVRDFFMPVGIPGLAGLPLVGKPLFQQSVLAYFGYAITVALAIYLRKTKAGLNLKAVGENTAAADASGINVMLYKYAHIIAGGGLCGIGGGFMSLVAIPVWQEGLIAGRGWIAVALVIFASWQPVKALLGAFLFGGLSILGFWLQSIGINISQYLVEMIPYIATILIVIVSTRKNRKEDMAPADIGNAYFREER